MTTKTAAIWGSWLFAVATAIAKSCSGFCCAVAWATAVLLSVALTELGKESDKDASV